MDFRALHEQPEPLLLANVWDVSSAKMAKELNFKAIGTSSAAMASLLGYEDGEELDFSELLYMVERIRKSTDLPLSVDIESGYSRSTDVMIEHILRLADLGVVGINIEDSVVSGHREMLPVEIFAQQLASIKERLYKEHIDLFVNVRTDAFLLSSSDALEESKVRISQYEKASADGIFVPGIEKPSDIEEIVNHASLPINVMCMPKLPNFNDLRILGVKRISMGNFLYEVMINQLKDVTRTVISQQSSESVFR